MTVCSVSECGQPADYKVMLYDFDSYGTVFLERDFTCPFICHNHACENETGADGERRPARIGPLPVHEPPRGPGIHDLWPARVRPSERGIGPPAWEGFRAGGPGEVENTGKGRIGREEAPVGVEPTYNGFADRRLTTWLRRRSNNPIGLSAMRARPFSSRSGSRV